MTTVVTDKAPAAIGPYSQAQKSGNLIFTSGQIGIEPVSGEMMNGIENQAEQVFLNLSEVLKASGSDMSKVIKTTVYIKNMGDFQKVNQIYAKFFIKPYPARSCLEVAALPKGALVECEAIAEL